jgi:threonine dehydrogenase-like Zn-dependent dehydrogenase
MTAAKEELPTGKTLDPENKRFIIVGAGPVGLLAAILLVQEIDALQVRHALLKGWHHTQLLSRR